jgi:hypothetical protein
LKSFPTLTYWQVLQIYQPTKLDLISIIIICIVFDYRLSSLSAVFGGGTLALIKMSLRFVGLLIATIGGWRKTVFAIFHSQRAEQGYKLLQKLFFHSFLFSLLTSASSLGVCKTLFITSSIDFILYPLCKSKFFNSLSLISRVSLLEQILSNL